MILAKYHAALVPIVIVSLSFFTILTTYGLAVHDGYVQPFPHTSITGTAEKGPQKFLFRIGLFIVAVFISWNWILVGNWVQFEQAKQENGNSDIATIVKRVGFVSGFFLCISTGTIDTTDMPTRLHGLGAVGFFLMSLVTQVLSTIKLYQLSQNNAQFINRWSLLCKGILSAISVGLLAFIIVALQVPAWKEDRQTLTNIVEWSVTLDLLLFNGLFAVDWYELYTAIEAKRDDETV